MSTGTGRNQERKPPAVDRGISGASGAARLRDRIDREAGGDKVAFQDPAAAPWGTDDEAAGTPPSQAQVSAAMQQETNRSDTADSKPGPADLLGSGWRPSLWLILAACIALAAVMIAVLSA